MKKKSENLLENISNVIMKTTFLTMIIKIRMLWTENNKKLVVLAVFTGMF